MKKWTIAPIFCLLWLGSFIARARGQEAQTALRQALTAIYGTYNLPGDQVLQTRMQLFPNPYTRQPYETETTVWMRKGKAWYSAVKGKLETLYTGKETLHLNHIRKEIILSSEPPRMNANFPAAAALGRLDSLAQTGAYALSYSKPGPDKEVFTLSFQNGSCQKMTIEWNPARRALAKVVLFYREAQKLSKDLPAAPLRVEIEYVAPPLNASEVLFPELSQFLTRQGGVYAPQKAYQDYTFLEPDKTLRSLNR